MPTNRLKALLKIACETIITTYKSLGKIYKFPGKPNYILIFVKLNIAHYTNFRFYFNCWRRTYDWVKRLELRQQTKSC